MEQKTISEVSKNMIGHENPFLKRGN